MDKSDQQPSKAEQPKDSKPTKDDSVKSKQAAAKPKKPKPAKSDKSDTSSRFAGYAFAVSSLAIVVSLAVAGAGIWFWQTAQQEASQQRDAQRTLAQQQIDSARSELTQMQLQTRAALSAAEKNRSQLQARIEKLQDELGRDRHAWALAEVRYTLRLANTRLQLFADVDSAQQALVAADRQLLELNDPALHKVRARLSQEISSLKSVPRIDVEGISLKLVALSERIRELVVKPPQPLTKATEITELDASDTPLSDWRTHADAVWSKLQKVIVIRNIDEPVKPLLAPEKAENLRLNIGLQIEQARLALLQGNTRLYQKNLQQADTWLGQYFNVGDEVAALQKQLQQLATINLRPALPNISTSLAELQRLSQNKGNNKAKTNVSKRVAKESKNIVKEKTSSKP